MKKILGFLFLATIIIAPNFNFEKKETAIDGESACRLWDEQHPDGPACPFTGPKLPQQG